MEMAGGSMLEVSPAKALKPRPRIHDKEAAASKRRCVSTACIACRKRKSKCDGKVPRCAACASVYGTDCIYDPNSDHRRKGVYKKDIDSLKTRHSTLHTLIEAILNYSEYEAFELVKQIRMCENLDDVADAIQARDQAQEEELETAGLRQDDFSPESPPTIEAELSGKMGELRVGDGSMRFIGGTSNLLFLEPDLQTFPSMSNLKDEALYATHEEALTSWTSVTADAKLVWHLVNMYFTWHYTYFTTLSKPLFFRDFFRGKPRPETPRKNTHCTSLLVNSILALGCHFTSWPSARSKPDDPSTAGDHFFLAAKRLLWEGEEHENPQLPTVQALCLMSVREAGCGREAQGWGYSGMSFRLAGELGLNVDSANTQLSDEEIDARRITCWGCFLFDKCWSNYLGRPPQLPPSMISTPIFEVFPSEDAALWSSHGDAGFTPAHRQPARTRAVARQISCLCRISNDVLFSFYQPTHRDRPQGRQAELKKLAELHACLEAWKKTLPVEMEAREGQLPHVLVMHMFYHLLYIHLFRPFLRQNYSRSPFPAHATPRKLCTHAASAISRLLRLYKRTYGMRQICNIAVYIAHSACTIHLLNLPDKDASRDIIHGVRQLEEIGESWWCARRTLSILAVQARRWSIDLPPETVIILAQNEARVQASKVSQPSLTTTEVTSTALAQDTDAHERPEASPPLLNPGEGLLLIAASANGQSAETRFSRSGDADSLQASLARERAPMQYFAPSAVLKNEFSPPPSQITTSHPFEPSPPAMFDSPALMLEDSQNWWLQDQSLPYENWSQPETVAGLSSSGIGQGLDRLTRDSGISLGDMTLDTMSGVHNMAYGVEGDQHAGGGFHRYGF